MSARQAVPFVALLPPARACPRAPQSPKGDFSPHFLLSGLTPPLGSALLQAWGSGHSPGREVQLGDAVVLAALSPEPTTSILGCLQALPFGQRM